MRTATARRIPRLLARRCGMPVKQRKRLVTPERDEAQEMEARWRSLINHYEPRLMRYAWRTHCSRGEAEEIVADVWADVSCLGADLTLQANPWPQLLEAVRRCCAERMRAWRREAGEPTAFVIDEARSDEPETDLEAWRAWWQAASWSLSEQQRIAVTFRYLWGWSMADLALVLGATEVTARVHLSRAIRRLKANTGCSRHVNISTPQCSPKREA